jgi:hypothetical protein
MKTGFVRRFGRRGIHLWTVTLYCFSGAACFSNLDRSKIKCDNTTVCPDGYFCSMDQQAYGHCTPGAARHDGSAEAQSNGGVGGGAWDGLRGSGGVVDVSLDVPIDTFSGADGGGGTSISDVPMAAGGAASVDASAAIGGSTSNSGAATTAGGTTGLGGTAGQGGTSGTGGAGGATGSGGASCPAGETTCKDGCVNLQSDNHNCGTCGSQCETGQQCSRGSCACDATSCSTGCCNGATCLATGAQTSAFCGAAGVACSPCTGGTSCHGGACGCSTGDTTCDGRCVNLQTDNDNCGSCGKACTAGQHCSGGTCVCDGVSCQNGCCNDKTCVGYSSQSTAVCGASGATCAGCTGGKTCQSGQCNCEAGLTPCSGTCANLQNDDSNCGACGTACATGQHCSGGTCVCDGVSCQNGCCSGRACIAYSSQSTAACGSAGVACAPCPGEKTCQSGVCGCTTGLTSCSGSCVNTQTNNSNCGACGNACADGQRCSGGTCVCDASSCAGGCCSGKTCVLVANQTPATCGGGANGSCRQCTGQACVNGGCTGSCSPSTSCDDQNECTGPDTCNSQGVCAGPPKAANSSCTKNYNGACQSGACQCYQNVNPSTCTTGPTCLYWGFESGTTEGWGMDPSGSGSGATNVSVSSTHVHTGSRALAITMDVGRYSSNHAESGASVAVPLCSSSGTVNLAGYKYSAWVYFTVTAGSVPANAANLVQGWLETSDSTRSSWTGSAAVAVSQSNLNQWLHVQGDVIQASSTNYLGGISVGFAMADYTSEGLSGTMYLDDVQFLSP